MRVGQNPAKSIEHVPQPQRVTVALVSYIPFLSGYYAQGLDVLKTCLGSLWDSIQTPYDLLVFDNGVVATGAPRRVYATSREIEMGRRHWELEFDAPESRLVSDHDLQLPCAAPDPRGAVLWLFPVPVGRGRFPRAGAFPRQTGRA